MEIAVQLNLATLEGLPHNLFDGVALWEKLGGWRHVLPIQIMARKTTAVVADYDAIRVKHRYNFEHKPLT